MRVVHEESRFKYKGGNGLSGFCGLQLLDIDGQYVLVVTELSSNTGPSVTNAIEEIVGAAYMRVAALPEIDELLIIEHYDNKSYKGNPNRESTFDVVEFKDKNLFRSPVWSPLRDERVLRLLVPHTLNV